MRCLVIQFKACPVQLSYKGAENDKHKMAERVSLHRKNKKAPPATSASPATSESDIAETLPPLKFQPEDNEGWTTFDDPLLYVYAGKGPFVGRCVDRTPCMYIFVN
jgi:sphingosine kinase